MLEGRQLSTAEQAGIREKVEKLGEEILAIPDVTSIDWDLDGFLSNIYQVIIIIGYDIRANREDYWDARSNLKHRVVDVANEYDLYRTSDPIEDMGEHFYFVFGCMESWRPGKTKEKANDSGGKEAI